MTDEERVNNLESGIAAYYAMTSAGRLKQAELLSEARLLLKSMRVGKLSRSEMNLARCHELVNAAMEIGLYEATVSMELIRVARGKE